MSLNEHGNAMRTFSEFMIITNRRYGNCPAMIIAVQESRRYILPKRPGPGRSGSSTYSCGIKVGRFVDRHRAGDDKKREQEGPWRESRLFMMRGGARNGNPALFEQGNVRGDH